MNEVVENIIVMLLTIVVLIGGGYLALLLLKWGLKLKGATQEDEGLVELWAESQKNKQAADSQEESGNDTPP